MTPLDALLELLARVGASQGEAVLVSEEELRGWPPEAVRALQSQKLLVKASPATSVECPGCEQQCTMPVHTLPARAGPGALFVVWCDKRDDINRVEVPAERLNQWQCSAGGIADLIAGLLDLRRPDSGSTSPKRWEIGMFKGTKHASHLVLSADEGLTVSLAGHSIALDEILTFESSGFKLDKRMLVRLVDRPIAGAGDAESAAQRRERLKKSVQAEKNKNNKAFLKTVAEAEGISVPRLKQLLQSKSASSISKSGRSAF